VTPTPEKGSSERDTATGRLLRAYQERGDERARDRLVQLYLPLVDTFAHRYQRVGAEHDDLMQVGSMGLLKAIERYDPRRGEEFAAFAVPTMVGEIKRHLRDRVASVKLPRSLQEAGARLPRVRAELSARLGRNPSDSELATELGITSEELASVEDAGRVLTLTDELAAHSAAKNGDSQFELSDSRLQLEGAFRALKPAEREIIYLRFVKDLSRKQTANELGISEGQLSRRTQAALAKLRGELERRGSGQPAAATPHRKKQPQGTRSAPPEDDRSEQPREKAKDSHSGRLLLRMPHSLHAELAQAAERDEVSLNQFITNTLAAAVSWQQADDVGNGGEAGSREPAPRWLSAAIVTNIVVVAVAGVVAVILLLVALQQGW
jgi:RNA polymerase sigma-B factor